MGTKVLSKQLKALYAILIVGFVLLLLTACSQGGNDQPNLEFPKSGQLETAVASVNAVLAWKTSESDRCEISVDFTGETQGLRGTHYFRDKPCNAEDIANSLENLDVTLGKAFNIEVPDWVSEVTDQFIAKLANYR